MSEARASARAAGDQARVSVRVDVPQAEAFEIFTCEIDRWWRRGPRFRQQRGESAVIAIEPRVGGRVFESVAEPGGDAHIVEIGHVLAWQPPRRLVFDWRNVTFAAGERTEVEVDFEARGEATLVTVTHRGWSALRPDHPARHGLAGEAFSRERGLWWGEQMSSLRRFVEGAAGAARSEP